MSLERRRELPQQGDVFLREVTRKAEPEIEAGGFMAGRPDDAVAILPVGILRVMVGDSEIEGCGDVHDGESSAGMAAAGGIQRYQVVSAHHRGCLLEFLNGVTARNPA